MHLKGRNEVENRNGACVMEVASLGSCAKIATEGGGKQKVRVSSRRNEPMWNEAEALLSGVSWAGIMLDVTRKRGLWLSCDPELPGRTHQSLRPRKTSQSLLRY
jgi:hypothetical protein